MKISVTNGMKVVQEQSDLEIEIKKGVKMHFRKIIAGSFRMGSRGHKNNEEPIHAVTILKNFYLGYFPVTLGQFLAKFTKHEIGSTDDESLPAVNMTWGQAIEFCEWLTEECNAQLKDEHGDELRATLPSEAHWEYACKTSPHTLAGRSDPETEFCSGDGEAALEKVGWFFGNSDGNTRPVGELTPNDWGLYDMHGNVCERCLDVWSEDAYRQGIGRDSTRINKSRRSEASFRVVRGGSCAFGAEGCRSAIRFGWKPGIIDDGYKVGFRVCLLYGTEVR